MINDATTYSYTPDGLSGIVRYDSRTSSYTPYAVETDHLGSITSLYNSSGTKVMGASFDTWGKRTVTTGTLEFRRGYTGHEHIDGYDLINMNSAIEREHGECYSPVPSVSRMGEANGRVYDPLIGRFLSPDPFVQMPDFSQSFNRYSYCLNNPYKYTDPDGEFVVALVGGILFATGMTNVIIQASNGSINSVGDVLSAFAGGVAAGVSEATSLAFGFAELSTGSPLGVLLGHSIIFGKSANFTTTSVNSILHPFNAAQIFMGRYYTDENKGAWDQFKQGLSRFTWEGPQTWAGYNWSQIRSIGDRVDRVDYLGGATFCINEDGTYGSVSLGNYINADIDGSYSGSITDYPTLMHEYGHTFDSREMGPM